MNSKPVIGVKIPYEHLTDMLTAMYPEQMENMEVTHVYASSYSNRIDVTLGEKPKPDPIPNVEWEYEAEPEPKATPATDLKTAVGTALKPEAPF